jgi:hypothetical protein
MFTALFATGWAVVNAWDVVAATAPGTVWLMYFVFVTFTFWFTTVLL